MNYKGKKLLCKKTESANSPKETRGEKMKDAKKEAFKLLAADIFSKDVLKILEQKKRNRHWLQVRAKVSTSIVLALKKSNFNPTIKSIKKIPKALGVELYTPLVQNEKLSSTTNLDEEGLNGDQE